MKVLQLTLVAIFFLATGFIKSNLTYSKLEESKKNISLKITTQHVLDLKDDLKKIMEDAEQDFEGHIESNIKDDPKIKHFKYGISIGGKEEMILKTFYDDSSINTIYFKSTFSLKEVEYKNKVIQLKNAFNYIAEQEEIVHDGEITKAKDAMNNNKTTLKNSNGNTLMLMVENTEKEVITIYVYGESSFKKIKK